MRAVEAASRIRGSIQLQNDKGRAGLIVSAGTLFRAPSLFQGHSDVSTHPSANRLDALPRPVHTARTKHDFRSSACFGRRFRSYGSKDGAYRLRSKQSSAAYAALGVAVFAITWWGWHTFWFLTDDAMIAFRYVSNSVAGRGLVWNPEPFAPVEGYTSFLWCVLLEAVWRSTGATPPHSSNVLALAFGYATLCVGLLLFRRVVRNVEGSQKRGVLLALVAALVLSNRTFFTWLSSGLETSLFNFCLTWWLYEALTPTKAQNERWLLRVTAAAAAIALTRPDGMLFVVATLVLVAFRLQRSEHKRFAPGALVWCAPLILVVAHVLWRNALYGDWLPSTFYAKYTGIAPGRGLRFLASFVIEYGLWWPLLLAAFVFIRTLRTRRTRPRPNARWFVFTALAAHVAFYTVATGGDHFEYRVFSYVPLLVAVATCWLALRATRRLAAAVACIVVYWLVSIPLPWAHWLETRDEQEYAGLLFKPVAPRFPTWLHPAVGAWDELQHGLIRESACIRHQEHKLYFESRSSSLPTREIGRKIPWEGRPVHVTGAVGIAGWVLPNVAIIDYLGLNDRVIARTPPTHATQLAHAHRPPEGYVDCFEPNVFAEEGMLAVEERATPLTDARIIECEQRDWSGIPPNLELELRRSRERRKRLYEIILDDRKRNEPSGDR